MTDQELDELARQERREYFRAWRAANKDKIRESNRRYWERRAAKKMQEAKRDGE